jgi:hypothetical protein
VTIHLHDTLKAASIESQLVLVIEQARVLAATAEELLREFVARKDGSVVTPTANATHVANFAPRMLACTNDQLQTIVEMLRQAEA